MNLNLIYKITRADCDLLSFSKTKKHTILFQKQSTFTPPRKRDRDLDHQIDVLNNLNLEKMGTKSKSNLSNVEQKQLSNLINDETIVIKLAEKGGAVVILSTGHFQSMIMQHLLDENTYKKLGSCIDNKMQSNL